jgi:hypothetical protein
VAGGVRANVPCRPAAYTLPPPATVADPQPRLFKLYYTPTSCGAASFIAATLGGLVFDSEQVDLATHRTQSGADFYTINPHGNVPTIVLPDGSILNENVAVLTYIADKGAAGRQLVQGSCAHLEAVEREIRRTTSHRPRAKGRHHGAL